MNFVWLAWAVLQIISVNVMFYGIKNIKWLLFLPHMVLRWVFFFVFLLRVALKCNTAPRLT